MSLSLWVLSQPFELDGLMGLANVISLTKYAIYLAIWRPPIRLGTQYFFLSNLELASGIPARSSRALDSSFFAVSCSCRS